MTKDTILSLLRQSLGEFVSGEVIRQAAGVSRAAVSKAVAVLRQEGHEIESVTNRGYRLISLADSLRPEELRQLAERVLQNDDIRYCPHGRPVCFELTRRELEKQFGRV